MEGKGSEKKAKLQSPPPELGLSLVLLGPRSHASGNLESHKHTKTILL
jgi:hypothetical protein